MAKLLLHTCCAPCLIYPLSRLKEKGYVVSGLFFNPNIHPFLEYNKRKQSVEDLTRIYGMEMFFPEYQPADFFQAVNLMESRIERCPICWFLRLKKTARLAKEKGFDTFSTTLLVSPYQDLDSLEEIGNNISKEEGISFYFEDFRPGFIEAHHKAKAEGLYCQKYCGCIYSEIERCRKSLKS